jgi:phosphoglycerate kinase
VFVNDAFGTAHRSAASNVGIDSAIKVSCIGFLIQLELDNLAKIVSRPQHPIVAILGGSKVSDKLAIIENLLKIADKILIVGGMANTFLTAQGHDMGSSKIEKDLVETARDIMKKDTDNKIVLPVDFLTANEFKDVKPIRKIVDDDFTGLMALDIGDESVATFKAEINDAKTIF